jgi:transketolase
LLKYLLREAKGSGYLRLVSIPCDVPYKLPDNYVPRAGVGVELRSGREAAIIGYGPVLLPQAWHAATLLKERSGLDVAVINLPWLSRVDRQWLAAAVAGRRAVFTLDNHFVDGGQGRMLAAEIAELGLDRLPRIRRFGLSDIPSCGQNAEVLRAHGLDAESLAQAMSEFLDGPR